MYDQLAILQQREIETLRERIRQLEAELCPPIAPPVEWGLTGSETRLWQHLSSRPIASKRSVMMALYSDRPDEEPDDKIADVFICKLRKKLRPFGVEIVTRWGQGWSLVDK